MTINPKFGALPQALYIAEEKARENIAARATIDQKIKKLYVSMIHFPRSSTYIDHTLHMTFPPRLVHPPTNPFPPYFFRNIISKYLENLEQHIGYLNLFPECGKIPNREREQKEEELRNLAARSRAERSGLNLDEDDEPAARGGESQMNVSKKRGRFSPFSRVYLVMVHVQPVRRISSPFLVGQTQRDQI